MGKPEAIAEREERITGLDRWSGTDWPNAADGEAATNPATWSNTKNLRPSIPAFKIRQVVLARDSCKAHLPLQKSLIVVALLKSTIFATVTFYTNAGKDVFTSQSAENARRQRKGFWVKRTHIKKLRALRALCVKIHPCDTLAAP